MSAPEVSRTTSPVRLGRTRRFAALVRKETIQVLRDPSSILIAFVLPMVLLFLFGYGVSLDANRSRIGLVIESASPLTQDLAASFTASSSFEVIHGRDRREFEDDLVLGRIGGIVVIPAAFTAAFVSESGPTVQVIVDGSDPNTANFVQNYVQGAITNWLALRNAESPVSGAPITVQQRFWFNPELTSRFFLVPGSIAIVMTLVGTLLTSLVVAREWERGTMEAIMATPVTALELLAGKLLPYFILGMMAMTLCVVVAVMLFDLPFRGSIVALYAVCSAFLIPALGQGLLISALTKNQFLASMVALLTAFLPAFLLSGFIFEIDSMPFVIRQLTRVVAASYLIPSLQTVFLVGDIWPMFASSIAMMLAIGAVFFLIAARSTRKRIG
ncbi:hypothetical protein CDV52_17845 [Haematobacter missouriensis]|uniref:ABC transmembrane type-2 domain-containing protein n=2 Tax=Haematobacter TaxID=366614 RepID=A0A212AJC1_9RHOB|nr:MULTISPECIES: ABC transporter permease [Haematobacter]OWJ76637.1 hypothetical protein CDV49_14210 [Haematobacter genomosp. 1]OWJ81533.1 hypothetical protein CDV52_17845 [Haematobacter missouriensis]